ncbi:MAG: hypothetical protein RIQ62_1048 [Bacteroidota bacterium]
MAQIACLKPVPIKKCFFVILIFSLSLQRVCAQSFRLQLRGPGADSFIHKTQLLLQYQGFIDCRESLIRARQDLLSQGYLLCSVDSLQWTDSNAQAYVQVGKPVRWAQLRPGNVPMSVLHPSGFEEKKFRQQAVSVQKVWPYFEKIITYFENNGYPFAALTLDSVQFTDDHVSAALHLERGPLIRIDTLLLGDESNVSRDYLMQYLGIQEGDPYNESAVKQISRRLRELPFAEEAYPWRIEFSPVRTKLTIYLRNKNANRADVLIGLLPNNQSNSGKLLLTGDIKLGFMNALNHGESMSINWQNLQYKSPRYNAEFQWPYLFQTPIGVSGKFDFYKRDTSVKNVNGELGLLYMISANDKIKCYYELSSSRLLNINVNNLVYTRALPENADVRYKTFGAEISLSRVDYKPNPRKGYRVLLNASASIRSFLKNNSIENTYDPVAQKNFSYLYDSIRLKTNKFSIRAEAAYFVSLSKRMVLATLYHGGLATGNDKLFRNELFQIGGYRLLRGFDEGSLFVSHYEVASIEPRFLLSPDSYFFLFSDIGWIQSNYRNISVSDKPYSVGAGMVFQTKGGLFNLAYALGGREQLGIQFKNSKVHFGYLSYF